MSNSVSLSVSAYKICRTAIGFIIDTRCPPLLKAAGSIPGFRLFTVKPNESNLKDEDECLVSRMRSPFSDCESTDEAIAGGTDRWVYNPPAETRRSSAPF